MTTKKAEIVEVGGPGSAVMRGGERIILPDKMTYKVAIEVLQRQMAIDEEPVSISRTIPCFPFDGAYALMRAMQQTFGWVTPEPTPGFFGPKPPNVLQIPIGAGQYVNLIWGQFSLPGVPGWVKTDVQRDNKGTLHFSAVAQTTRANSALIGRLFDLTEHLVKTDSIYRGKAIKLRLFDDDGDRIGLPIPEFIDTASNRDHDLVFSTDIMGAIETCLFTPLRHREACMQAGIPMKRGILFEGPYGVGKSLTAYVTAKTAVTNGWTYLYCERANEMEGMIQIARQYQPAVLFCEDIDRVMSGERHISMDAVLNILDGVEAHGINLVTVLTTNHVDKINPAMLRPGRLDAIISLRPPDREAILRLFKLYSRGHLQTSTPADEAALQEAASLLEGRIPAAIQECVERAKLSALKLSDGTTSTITGQAILDSAKSMRSQFKLMTPQKDWQTATREELVTMVAKQVVDGLVRVGTNNSNIGGLPHEHTNFVVS